MLIFNLRRTTFPKITLSVVLLRQIRKLEQKDLNGRQDIIVLVRVL